MIPKSTATTLPSASTSRLPGCRSAWKKPSRKTWLKKAPAALPSTLARVVPGGDQGVALVDGDALDPLQREHAAAGAPPVHRRHQEAGVLGEVLAQLGSRRGLEAEVHLHHHTLGEGADHLDRPQPAPGGQGPLGEFRHPVEELEIALQGALDAGPQDLDRDRLARGGDREMHLRDGGGGDGLVVEFAKERLKGCAELGFDDGARGLRVEGRQTVLKRGEGGRGFLAHQVRPGAERLAELDEARPQHLERAGEALPRRAQPPLARRHAGEEGDRRHQPVVAQQEERVPAPQGPGDTQQPPDISERPPHGAGVRRASPNGAWRCRRRANGRARRRSPRLPSSRPAAPAAGSAGCSPPDRHRRRAGPPPPSRARE